MVYGVQMDMISFLLLCGFGGVVTVHARRVYWKI